MARGKRSLAELFIDPREITFVTCESGDNDEFVFNLRDASEKALYYFAMSHEYEAVETTSTHHWN
jgi:hypothetical protein